MTPHLLDTPTPNYNSLYGVMANSYVTWTEIQQSLNSADICNMSKRFRTLLRQSSFVLRNCTRIHLDDHDNTPTAKVHCDESVSNGSTESNIIMQRACKMR
jgi:hypothetical protein